MPEKLSVSAKVLHATGIVRAPWLTQRLWLAFDDGRIAALRLDAKTEINDTVLTRLATVAGEDARGELVEIGVSGRSAFPLYAAPAEPPAGGSGALDQAVVALLRSLNGIRVFDTVRNYNRLVALDAERRRNRMQAIAQYPAILSHVFLTPHHDYDLVGGSHHRWRMHDDELVAAVDSGHSLLPLLAARGGVSKGVFRAPAFQENWPSLALARPHVLHVLDGIPAHCRPTTTDELALATPVFALLNRHGVLAPTLLRCVGGEFFRAGITGAMARVERRYGVSSLDDADDFLRALAAFMADRGKHAPPAPDDSGKPWLAAWLSRHGLWPLLAASARWHAGLAGKRHRRAVDRQCLPVVLGRYRIGEWEAIELDTAAAIEEEGKRMHHCVATRWPDCAAGGARLFTMKRMTNGSEERATAQFDLVEDPRGRPGYALRELRGPANAAVGPDCRAAACRIETLLNAPERRNARAEAAAAAARYRAPEPPVVWLDEESARLALELVESANGLS